MSDSNREKALKVRAVGEQVRQILLEDWDPIGVRDEPAAQDEYDAYVGRVVSLIASGRGSLPIAEYLYDLEINRMGLDPVGTAIRLEPEAQRLAALAEKL